MPKAFTVMFCGTAPFAAASLKALADDPAFTVELVITQPDKPSGRDQKLTPPPVKTAAAELGIPLLQPSDINALLHKGSAMRLHHPDLLVVVAYGQILSKDLLDFPKVAAVNVHGSLLPRWRGASPIQHAILAGDAETGVTIQEMAMHVDAGPILAQERIAIAPDDTTATLSEKLSRLGARLLVRTLKEPLQRRAQDEAAVTQCRKLRREDGIVDIDTMTAEEIHRRVRALHPWPGVTITGKDGEVLKILKTSLTPQPEGLEVTCKDGTILYFVTVQPPGKKPMSGLAWERGIRKGSKAESQQGST